MSRRTHILPVAILIFTALLSAQTDPQKIELTRKLADAALERSTIHVRYVPDYVRIAYPGGDVPADTGVCTDEIIRIYRKVGIDLQKEVHEDMVRARDAYPNNWRTTTDTNIDHRRVPNLIVFFQRNGVSLPTTTTPADYLPGDIVTWDLGKGLTHIGMVVDKKTLFRNRYKVLHNIGRGPEIEDVLFDWKITGHFRYYGPPR